MSLELLGALAADALRCPKCDAKIKNSRDYKADIVDIPGVGGMNARVLRGEQVTLLCEKCGAEHRTDNWRAFIKV